ncbi:MAG: serine/threonine-protein kinase [Rhodanobacteraceae bacterium]
MAPDKFDDALSAIADGTPVPWQEIDRAHNMPDRELESLHLLHEVARAFRAGEASPTANAVRAAPLFRWGTLEVEQRLGAGSFGEVWRAFDPWLGRAVALKLQHVDANAPTRRSEQLDEARRLARIRHPNVLSCYGCAVHDGRAGLWSELIEGRSLAEVLVDDGALSIEEALRIGRDLARALGAVHAAGLVHGDIKAANVMRERGGRIVLMDFGAGGEERLLALRRLVSGTPAYLAPEVLDGAPLSARSDLYAFGILLFLLLTGRMPYAADSVAGLRAAQRDRRREKLATLRPDIDADLAAAIERCMDSDPAARPQDAGEIASALAIAARGASAPVPDHPARSRRWGYGIGGVAVAVAALAIGWSQMLVPAWSADAAFIRTRGNTIETLRDDATVRAGDRLRLRLHSNRASSVYVLNEDSDGNATVLYPLDGGTTSVLPLRSETVLPGATRDPTLAWEVTGDSAREEFLVVAALKPGASLESSIAAWRRSAQSAPDDTTRSLGALVSGDDAPVLHGVHLRTIVAELPQDRDRVRTWRYAFMHSGDP